MIGFHSALLVEYGSLVQWLLVGDLVGRLPLEQEVLLGRTLSHFLLRCFLWWRLLRHKEVGRLFLLLL